MSAGPAATQDDIAACFRLLLGRTPSPEEWAGHCTQAGQPLAAVVGQFLRSPEFAARTAPTDSDSRVLTRLPGFALYTSEDDLAVGRHVAGGVYEPEIAALFRSVLRPGMTVVDVGANIGLFTMLAASLVGPSGLVVAIEPNLANVAMIEASRRANGFDHVAIAACAVARSLAPLVLQTTYSNGATSPVDGPADAIFAAGLVAGVPLSRLLPDRPIDLVKLDVEGAEYVALADALPAIVRHRPVIVSEFSPGLLAANSGVTGAAFLDLLTGHGYEAAILQADGPPVPCESIEQAEAALHASGGADIDLVFTPNPSVWPRGRQLNARGKGDDHPLSGAGQSPAANPSRIVFANQLRGLSVLAVLLVHYTVVAQLMRKDVAWVIAAPPLDGPVPQIAYWANTRWLDLGKFGVSAFFLISGFVIPFSLQGATAARFLLARALRIYPTFWVALLVEGGAIAASSAYWHIPAPYGLRDYVVNGLLIETLLDLQTVDWVSWTLSVEVKFYILAALLRPLILASRVWPLAALAGGGVALNALQGAGLVHLPDQLVSEAMYVGFILIGTLFHYHHQGRLSTTRLVLAGLALTAAFFASYGLGPTRGGFYRLPTLSYALAIVAFAAGYVWRAKVRPNRVLDGLAAISYPLYLIHSVVGFTIIAALMMGARVPYGVAAITAAGVTMLIAWALHGAVEMPTVRMGHALRHARPRVATAAS